jgi:hypothetical protein
MNKALYIIAVPAVVVSAFWFWIGWGLLVAAAGTGLVMAAILAAIIFLERRMRVANAKANEAAATAQAGARDQAQSRH